MAKPDNTKTYCLFDSYKEMLHTRPTQTTDGKPVWNIVAPREETYEEDGKIIHKSYLLMIDPTKFNWKSMMSQYYKDFIQYCMRSRSRWQPPADLAEKVQVYPRFYDNNIIMLIWVVNDSSMFQKFKKLMHIQERNLFDPKICIESKGMQLVIDHIPIMHNSKPMMPGSNLLQQDIPNVSVKQIKKSETILKKHKRRIISTGYLKNNQHIPFFIIRKIKKIPNLAHQILILAPLKIISRANSLKTVNALKTARANERTYNITPILSTLVSNFMNGTAGIVTQQMEEIVKNKECGWCYINNEELKAKKKKNKKLKICRCKKIYYCCRNHQKRDWKSKHRVICIAKLNKL